MKPKPQPPKDKREYLAAKTVGQLQELLKKFPRDAKIYTTYDGCVIVYQGKKILADINLTGY